MRLYYLCSQNKGTDQLRSYCAADLQFCFRIYAKRRFSHDATHTKVNKLITFVCACASLGVC